MPGLAVTVVIATHERPEDCREAVESALSQDPAPLEVLISDDGSGSEAEGRLRRLAAEDARVRYLRVDPSAGRPAPARNLGIKEARGTWVAFLDDDDRWLPGKLAAQMELINTERYDVVASDALRTSGGRYFGGRGHPLSPNRSMFAATNPVIISTAVVRRAALLEADGFQTQRRMAGVEDYGLWVRLADRGARFVIADEPLAVYDDASATRLSAARVLIQIRLARFKWRRVRSSPTNVAALRAAGRETATLVLMLLRAALRVSSARRAETP